MSFREAPQSVASYVGSVATLCFRHFCCILYTGKEQEELTIAGFWGHCRRRFHDALEVIPKNYRKESRIPQSGKTKEAFTYALNQGRYLRVFLETGDVPMDNNASERTNRGFCIGKKKWEMIDTANGATSLAIIYSIAETAKANDFKPYDYFEYLLTEIPKHEDDTSRDFLKELLPWSETLPGHIRKPQTSNE